MMNYRIDIDACENRPIICGRKIIFIIFKLLSQIPETDYFERKNVDFCISLLYSWLVVLL